MWLKSNNIACRTTAASVSTATASLQGTECLYGLRAIFMCKMYWRLTVEAFVKTWQWNSGWIPKLFSLMILDFVIYLKHDQKDRALLKESHNCTKIYAAHHAVLVCCQSKHLKHRVNAFLLLVICQLCWQDQTSIKMKCFKGCHCWNKIVLLEELANELAKSLLNVTNICHSHLQISAARHGV